MTANAGWFETLERHTAYEGWSRVHVDQVRMPDGAVVQREVVEHRGAVAVVPLLDDGSVVLLRQYRHAVGGYVLEIPAGKLDVDGEAPTDAAQRELVEEIGMRAGSLVELTTILNSAGWTDETTSIHLGRRLVEAPRPADFALEAEEADMEILRLPLTDAIEAVSTGTIRDAKTVVGLLLTQQALDQAQDGQHDNE